MTQRSPRRASAPIDDRGAGADVEAAAVADAAAVAERHDGAGREVEAHAASQPRPAR